MEIQVRLHGALSRYRPPNARGQGPFTLHLPDGTTVAQLIEQLGAPASWVRSSFVNDRPAQREQPLHDGDSMALFPPVGGGDR